jgi:archaemetzincin
MQKIVFLSVCYCFLIACNQRTSHLQTSLLNSPPDTILLQPLDKFNINSLNFLKDTLTVFYQMPVTINAIRKTIPSAWYAPRKRWVADSIIAWLKPSATNNFIVGLTEADIATKKGHNINYGIMGLGFQPGNACVVSGYRLRNSARNTQQYRLRLFKVAAHELGHNFGLPHCSNEHCIMADAEGKMKLEQEQGLCDSCNLLLVKNKKYRHG